ncbi:MAG: GAK system XXXCH domain-containing protein [Pseudomonadota bacterium]
MDDDLDSKNKAQLSPSEAAAMLRRLAEQLEQGFLLLEGRRVLVEHALILEQGVKTKDGGLSYKIKLKYKPVAQASGPPEQPALAGAPPAPSSTGGGAAPSFKALKKSLGRAFKQAQAAIKTGGLPTAELAGELLAICRQMPQTPQGGGQGFMELTQQGHLLLQAVEQSDATSAGQAVQAMARIKSSCHAAIK